MPWGESDQTQSCKYSLLHPTHTLKQGYTRLWQVFSSHLQGVCSFIAFSLPFGCNTVHCNTVLMMFYQVIYEVQPQIITLLYPFGQIKPHSHGRTPLQSDSAVWRDYSHQAEQAAKQIR